MKYFMLLIESHLQLRYTDLIDISLDTMNSKILTQ